MQVINLLTREYNNSYQHKRHWTTALNAYKALSPEQRKLAAEGIFRHVRASENCDLHLDYSAIGEIIMDAKNDRQIWKESDSVFLNNIGTEAETEFKARLDLPSFV